MSRPPGGARPDASARSLIWRIALLVAAIVLVYANGLSGPFILDDQSSVVQNRQIAEWWRPGSVLAPDRDSSVAGRPLANASFAFNYALGGLDVRGYHAWNIAVHVVAVLLAFGLVRRTLMLPRVRGALGAAPEDVACAVALLWAVHPLNSEAVNYITQRTESMMAAFLLLLIYAAARHLDRPSPRWTATMIAALVLGIGCKESMAVAPLVALLYERAYGFATWRETLARRWPVYATLVAITALLAGIAVASGPRAAVVGVGSGVSPWTYLWNQAVLITHYLRLAFWPQGLVVFYGWPRAVTMGEVAPYLSLVGALAIAAITLLVRAPRIGFLAAAFFITLAPSSSLVPIATEVGAERRMYVPLLALIALVVVAIVWVRDRWAARRARAPLPYAGAALLAVAAVALGIATVIRTREYQSAVALAQTVVDRRPTAIAHHILAEQLQVAGRSDEAIPHLHEAMTGGDSKAAYALGVELFNRGRYSEAAPLFDAFLATAGRRLVPRWLEPSPSELVVSRLALGRMALMQQRPVDAASHARAALALVPRHRGATQLLADALFAGRQYDDALVYYRELASATGTARAWMNVGLALVGSTRVAEAIEPFRRGVMADPRDPAVRRMLTLALIDTGRYEDAIAEARVLVSLDDRPETRQLLSEATRAAGH